MINFIGKKVLISSLNENFDNQSKPRVLDNHYLVMSMQQNVLFILEKLTPIFILMSKIMSRDKSRDTPK